MKSKIKLTFFILLIAVSCGSHKKTIDKAKISESKTKNVDSTSHKIKLKKSKKVDAKNYKEDFVKIINGNINKDMSNWVFSPVDYTEKSEVKIGDKSISFQNTTVKISNNKIKKTHRDSASIKKVKEHKKININKDSISKNDKKKLVSKYKIDSTIKHKEKRKKSSKFRFLIGIFFVVIVLALYYLYRKLKNKLL